MNPLIDTVQKNEKSTRFVSVQYGPTKRGAVGVYTMILADYGRIIRRDLAQVKSLKDVDLTDLAPEGIDLATMQDARDALIAGFEASIQRAADGQPRKGDYTAPVTGPDGEKIQGMSAHVEDPDRVYVAGIVVAYREIEPGEPKKAVNSRPLTIAKNAIRSRLTSNKWKHLEGGKVVTLAANGERYEAPRVEAVAG